MIIQKMYTLEIMVREKLERIVHMRKLHFTNFINPISAHFTFSVVSCNLGPTYKLFTWKYIYHPGVILDNDTMYFPEILKHL